jgi:hypothetical protein
MKEVLHHYEIRIAKIVCLTILLFSYKIKQFTNFESLHLLRANGELR